MWIARLACTAYVALLTLLLLAPNPAMLPGVRRLPHMVSDVAIHFGAFVLVGIFVLAARPPMRRAYLIALLAAYAVGVELAQYFVPPRTVDLRDLFANLSGLTVGVLAWQAAVLLTSRRCRTGPVVLKPGVGFVEQARGPSRNAEGEEPPVH